MLHVLFCKPEKGHKSKKDCKRFIFNLNFTIEIVRGSDISIPKQNVSSITIVTIISYYHIIIKNEKPHKHTRNIYIKHTFQILIVLSLCRPQKHGARMKCSACKIIAHASCISIVMERTQMACKPTFRDVGVRQYREQTTTHHHWVHRRTEKGKCKQCGKVCNAVKERVKTCM